MFVKRQLKLVLAMHPYLVLNFSSVLRFLVPPEDSSGNGDEIMIVGLFYHSPSDLTAAIQCCHHTRNSVTAITGSCDLISFESLRMFFI